MEKYSFTYRSFSTYDTSVRSQTREEPVLKPVVPFIPQNKGNSMGHVVKKTIVPVASRNYEDDYHHTHSSPTRSSDDQRHRPTSPLHHSPRKVDDFRTKEGHKPIGGTIKSDNHGGYNNGTSNGYGHYGRNKEGTKAIGGTMKNYDDRDGYNGTGYGDYGRNREGSRPIGGKSEPHDGYNSTNSYGNQGSNKEGRKPFGGISTIRNHDNPNGYNGTNAYGDSGNNGSKEGRKPIKGTVKNYETHDGYIGANGYRDGYSSNKEGHKPIGGTIRNYDNRDGYNGTNGYGDSREGRKPIGGTNRNYDNRDGYNGYGDGHCNTKEGHKPLGGTVRNYDNRDGYNGTNSYGDGYGNKEGRKPIGGTVRNENCDGSNGYGDYYGNKEGHRQIGSTIKYDNHDGYNGPSGYGDYNNKEMLIKPMVHSGGWSRSKFSSGWTTAPRKGTQLSEPTSDIGEAIELLKKEAAKMSLNDHGNKDSYDDYQRRHDVSSPLNNWARPSGNGFRLSDPISKYEKDDYGESIHKRDGTPTRPYGNSNPSSRPRTSTHVAFFDASDADYGDVDASRYGIMDSREAEKRFKGTRIS